MRFFMSSLIIFPLKIYIGGLLFYSTLNAQENRDYILKVDFGPRDRQADFWYNWEERNSLSKASRYFPNVFNVDGFGIQMDTDCGTSSSSNCSMSTRFRSEVVDSILDPLVADGLFVSARRLSFQLTDLAAGSYDFKGYFHDALQSSDVRLAIRIFDARSPGGFLLSNAIRVSSGRKEPTVSTFTFPIEANGQSPIWIVITSNIDGFWLNGFELTRFHYRERNSEGVELIPQRRYQEALITAYLTNNERWYGCVGRDIGGRTSLGYWTPESGDCRSLDDIDREVLANHRLIKFDPYFEWRYVQNSMPNMPVNFHQDAARPGYACIIQLANGNYYPGIVKAAFASSCLAAPDGEEIAFNNYWVFSRKP